MLQPVPHVSVFGLDDTTPRLLPPALVKVSVEVVVPMVSKSLAALLVGLVSTNAPLDLTLAALVTLPGPLPAITVAVIRYTRTWFAL